MFWSPRLIRSATPGGQLVVRLGHPVVDVYLEFAAARCRPNTVLAAGFDLKVFFTLVPKDPAEVTRLAFIEPGSTTTSVHLVGVTDGSGHAVLQVDLGEFCRTMVQAAVEWLDANQDNPTVQANLGEVMTVYPDGAGGIAGVPVVM